MVARSAHSSFSVMSEYSSPLCSGLVEGKILTVLTFSGTWALSAHATRVSFLPLTCSLWQSVCWPRYRGRGARRGWQGPNRSDKGQWGVPCSSADRRGACCPVLSASPFLWLLLSHWTAARRYGKGFVQPVSCWTEVTLSHPVLLVFFLLFLLSDGGFLPFLFLFFAY